MNALTIGKVAKLARVGVETIRYYEREGILRRPSRLAGSYREYSPDAVNRLRFIKRAQELGFSLREITKLLSLRVEGRGACSRVKRRAEEKMGQIEEKISDLKRIKAALSRVIDHCDRQAPEKGCPVLDGFYA
ncbi:MAG: MerR family transcriptional regulator [Elusimicrobia bacterium]|nr:MerR family transcriptional regulator [Elusimicrobiota bacterium]